MEEKKSLHCQNFVTVRLLSQGSFSSVYLIKDPDDNDKNYVLKKILRSNYKVNALTESEIKILKKLYHCEYVSQLLENTKDENYFYLYFPFHNFIDLFNLIENDKLDFQSKKIISLNLAKAIIAIHELNIIHDDLKPENVICNTETLQVQLIDFNLSADLDSDEFISKGGSESYKSPEKKNSKIFDGFKSDTYSYGIILFVTFLKFVPENIYYFYQATRILKLFNLFSSLVAENPKDRISLTEAIKDKFFE